MIFFLLIKMMHLFRIKVYFIQLKFPSIAEI